MTPQSIFVTVLICAGLAAWVVQLVARGRLYAGYGVVWLVVLGGAVVFVGLPPLRALLVRVSGAERPVSALTLTAFAFVTAVLIYYSVQLSILARRVNRVAQELGTLMLDLREASAERDRD